MDFMMPVTLEQKAYLEGIDEEEEQEDETVK